MPGADITIENVGLNPTRTGILEVLDQMGARIEVLNPRDVAGEPVGDLRVTHGPLQPFDFGDEIMPRLVDEVPILSVAACFCDGESRISGASELRVKETDRLAVMARQLKAMGADIEEHDDGMTIRGGRPHRYRAGQRNRPSGGHEPGRAAMLAKGDSSLACRKRPPFRIPPSGMNLNGSAAELGLPRPYPTADGSFSLHSAQFGEAFHNSAGALNEAQAKFVRPAQLERFQGDRPLAILDVCVGLGYNSAAVLEALPAAKTGLHWWGWNWIDGPWSWPSSSSTSSSSGHQRFSSSCEPCTPMATGRQPPVQGSCSGVMHGQPCRRSRPSNNLISSSRTPFRRNAVRNCGVRSS